jgi:ribonuclease III
MPSTETTSYPEHTLLTECQDAIGYHFGKVELLRAALTHTSGANTRGASNERLEFLGDSVLGLITCEQLFSRFPDYQEGDLTKIKSVIVSRKTCAKFGEELGLDDFLFLGKGMTGIDVPMNVLANTFEALVAAIFLDGGWEAARVFVLDFIEPEIDHVTNEAMNANSKSALQQVAQRDFGSTPRYVILDEQGPDHNKCFKISAQIQTERYPAAWGKNKKEAELKAAMNALAVIQGQAAPYACD